MGNSPVMLHPELIVQKSCMRCALTLRQAQSLAFCIAHLHSSRMR